MAAQTIHDTTGRIVCDISRATRLVVALFCLLTLTSCSSIQFAYNQLDTWLRWRLDDYVDLNGGQKNQLTTSLESFHRWHRQTQLPRYAEFLDELAYEASNGDLESVSLPAIEEDLSQFWDTSSNQLYRQLLPLAAQLTPAQIDELEQSMLEKRMESLEKWQRSPEKVRERRNKRIRKQSQRWLGSVNGRQEQLIAAFVDQVAYNPLLRDQQRQIWQARFISVLREKPEGYQQHLLDLMHNPEQLWSEDYRRMQAERREQAMRLSRELLASTTPEQRRHLTETLRDYASDFRTLAQR
ncbi:DUF6279 family lipoprotein [Microbulbifer guangxiensis]|uniref:DUF6279 family lipoprotein n=1 Tax=Microbulbifer guangxiensis TaxID=2904249 RepID=UPI001F1AE128|nr:DUF6279 family lipoprotein [Microbulbifer guangxiensis]